MRCNNVPTSPGQRSNSNILTCSVVNTHVQYVSLYQRVQYLSALFATTWRSKLSRMQQDFVLASRQTFALHDATELRIVCVVLHAKVYIKLDRPVTYCSVSYERGIKSACVDVTFVFIPIRYVRTQRPPPPTLFQWHINVKEYFPFHYFMHVVILVFSGGPRNIPKPGRAKRQPKSWSILPLAE
jgi:hypothetical protein